MEDKKVEKPWGHYEVVFHNSLTKLKIITIFPKQKISLQSHVKRSEHWVVLEGKAIVCVGDEVSSLEVNQYIFIPVGERHRIENNELTDLRIVEVQTGQSFNEDDIVRYNDIYGRV